MTSPNQKSYKGNNHNNLIEYEVNSLANSYCNNTKSEKSYR